MHASSGRRHQVLRVLAPLELRRNLSEEAEEGGVQMINLLVPVGAVDRAARIQDLLHSSQDLRNILREPRPAPPRDPPGRRACPAGAAWRAIPRASRLRTADPETLSF